MHPYKYINMSIFLEKYVHFLFGKSLNGTVIAERDSHLLYHKLYRARTRVVTNFFLIFIYNRNIVLAMLRFFCVSNFSKLNLYSTLKTPMPMK